MSDISDWSGALGANWASRADVMERMLAPFGEAAMAVFGDLASKRVLDLGCGGGATTLTLAGKAKEAVGIDVSPDLIALAERRRQSATGAAKRATFVHANAAEARFDAPFDALFSQYGAMFFDDPEAAYANLHSAMTPDARLAIACWRTPRENEWASVPLNAAKPLLPELPPADRYAPGPFAWSTPEETFAPMLAAAGWRDVSWRPVDHLIEMGAGMEAKLGGDDPLERAVVFSTEIGPLARRLEDQDESRIEEIRGLVREVLTSRVAEGRVALAGAGWVVTARA